MTTVGEAVAAALGEVPVDARPLSGGCVGEVVALRFADGRELVAKHDPSGRSGLDVEARMLGELAARTRLPVPEVVHATAELLVMTRLAGHSGVRGDAEEHLADLVADLHAVRGDAFGLGYDTRIGGLVQPNAASPRWLPFFAARRLNHFACEAQAAGRLPAPLVRGVEAVASKLAAVLDEPPFPSLVHGDLWSGNVLSDGGRVTGLIDPAIHHAHPEVELAFMTLFGSVGERFFARYRERTGGPDREFFAARRDLYNLYPLLVHVCLFGGSYVDDVARVVRRYA